MEEIKFRNTPPKRNYDGDQLSPYRKYKPFLREDFNKRCGYTDCPDFWFGGKSNYHIDHFLPKSKHPHLELEYGNLVYSCSFVNRAKSDDEGLYLDPCESDFNEHFYRDDNGNIIPNKKSKEGNYMHGKLKLYLRRYGLVWALDNLREKIKELDKVIKSIEDKEKRLKALELYHELSSEFHNYLDYLEIELD